MNATVVIDLAEIAGHVMVTLVLLALVIACCPEPWIALLERLGGKR